MPESELYQKHNQVLYWTSLLKLLTKSYETVKTAIDFLAPLYRIPVLSFNSTFSPSQPTHFAFFCLFVSGLIHTFKKPVIKRCNIVNVKNILKYRRHPHFYSFIKPYTPQKVGFFTAWKQTWWKPYTVAGLLQWRLFISVESQSHVQGITYVRCQDLADSNNPTLNQKAKLVTVVYI